MLDICPKYCCNLSLCFVFLSKDFLVNLLRCIQLCLNNTLLCPNFDNFILGQIAILVKSNDLQNLSCNDSYIFVPNIAVALAYTPTFIIGHYNPSVRIVDLVSHTIYVVCFNFIHKWRNLRLKFDSERQIFKKLFLAILFALIVFARNLLRGN